MRAAVAEHVRLPFVADLEVLPSALGQQAGLVGAAALVANDAYWNGD
jgi:glucokinase